MSPAPSALGRAVPLLRCPNCGAGMSSSTSGVVCDSGHSFDRARQGHLTVLGGRGRRFPGDTADQVASRDRVLGSGLFDPVADALGEAGREGVGDAPGPVVLDVGAGTGFYLGRQLDGLTRDGARPPLGIGTELSAAAARRLARAHPHAAALVADTWDGLPLADRAVDLLQAVFAPRNPAEFARVVPPGATLVVALPGAGHLEPLRSRAGMLTPAVDKAVRLTAELAGAFTPAGRRDVDVTSRIPASLAADLAVMGPSGVHLDRHELAHGLGDAEHPVRVHVEVCAFRRTGEPLHE